RRALPHDLYSSFISHSYGDHRYLASFPTRRSSDLLAFPQDVQTEAYDYPEESLARRVWHIARPEPDSGRLAEAVALIRGAKRPLDRKSTRLNSSHGSISYAVFCLKKKKRQTADFHA